MAERFPELRGHGFQIRLSDSEFRGSRDAFYEHLDRTQSQNLGLGFHERTAHSDGTFTFRYGGEVLIRARTRLAAQRRLHLILASIALIEGSVSFIPDDMVALPIDGDCEDLEHLRGTSFFPGRKATFSTPAISDACLLAVRCSRRRHLQYALYKLYLSLRAVSPEMVDLDPSHAQRKFSIEPDPLHRVFLANAVTLAYSAIEEMQLEIRASERNPTLLTNKTWNPKVKNDLEQRLIKAGISVGEDQLWTLRGPPTRLERKLKFFTSVKPSWSKGPVVRDVLVPIAEALRIASWLRSKVTTHRFVDSSRSLTVYDAHNVQFLARRLLLEQLGWAWPPSAPG